MAQRQESSKATENGELCYQAFRLPSCHLIKGGVLACQSVTALKNRIYVFAGVSLTSKRSEMESELSNQMLKYDIDQKRWSIVDQKGKWPTARYGHSATLYKESIYIFGGESRDRMRLNDLWMFDCNDETFTEIKARTAKPVGRAHHGSLFRDGNLTIFGAANDFGFRGDMWKMDLNNERWKKLVEQRCFPFYDFAPDALDGYVYGQDVASHCLHKFDLETLEHQLISKEFVMGLTTIGAKLFGFTTWELGGRLKDLVCLDPSKGDNEWKVVGSLEGSPSIPYFDHVKIASVQGSNYLFGGYGLFDVPDNCLWRFELKRTTGPTRTAGSDWIGGYEDTMRLLSLTPGMVRTKLVVGEEKEILTLSCFNLARIPVLRRLEEDAKAKRDARVRGPDARDPIEIEIPNISGRLMRHMLVFGRVDALFREAENDPETKLRFEMQLYDAAMLFEAKSLHEYFARILTDSSTADNLIDRLLMSSDMKLDFAQRLFGQILARNQDYLKIAAEPRFAQLQRWNVDEKLQEEREKLYD